MFNIKTVIASVVLASVAGVSFAQAPAAVKSAPAMATTSATAVNDNQTMASAKPATKAMVKKTKHVKKAKHVKAKKVIAS